MFQAVSFKAIVSCIFWAELMWWWPVSATPVWHVSDKHESRQTKALWTLWRWLRDNLDRWKEVICSSSVDGRKVKQMADRLALGNSSATLTNIRNGKGSWTPVPDFRPCPRTGRGDGQDISRGWTPRQGHLTGSFPWDDWKARRGTGAEGHSGWAALGEGSSILLLRYDRCPARWSWNDFFWTTEVT